MFLGELKSVSLAPRQWGEGWGEGQQHVGSMFLREFN
jgi:hypothetical protein